MSEGTIITREQAEEWSTTDFDDCVVEMWEEKLHEEYGFYKTGIGIRFSGFYSQGDGASLTGLVGAPATFLQKLMSLEDWTVLEGKRALCDDDAVSHFIEDISISVVYRTSRYYHENTVEVELVLPEWHEDPEAFADDLKIPSDKEMTEFVRGLCREIYEDLEKEYEYRCSDEALLEMAEANDYKIIGLNYTEPENDDNE